MHPAERDDLRRLAALVFWFAPRDYAARELRRLADLIEVKPWP
jgi:hypothetical protein